MPANGARISDAPPSAQVPVRTRALICPRNRINPLDETCKEHDIACSQNKALSERHWADYILIDKAWSRVKAPDINVATKTLKKQKPLNIISCT